MDWYIEKTMNEIKDSFIKNKLQYTMEPYALNSIGGYHIKHIYEDAMEAILIKVNNLYFIAIKKNQITNNFRNYLILSLDECINKKYIAQLDILSHNKALALDQIHYYYKLLNMTKKEIDLGIGDEETLSIYITMHKKYVDYLHDIYNDLRNILKDILEKIDNIEDKLVVV